MGEGTKKNTARSFAEEGLEQIHQEAPAAEQAVASNEVSSSDDGDFQQVGGLEPVAYFLRLTPPKKTPKQPFKILEKGQTIVGRYERAFSGGKFGNKTYLVRLDDKSLIGLPGAASLSRAMEKLAEGSRVKITYEGMSEIKSGEWAGNDAHNFVVFGNKLKS